jgi:hypothetical protein
LKVTAEDVKFRQQWQWDTNGLVLIAHARPGSEKGRPTYAVGVRIPREYAEDSQADRKWKTRKGLIKASLRHILVNESSRFMKAEGAAVELLPLWEVL